MAGDDKIKLDFRAEAARVAEAPKPFLELFKRHDVLVELYIPRDRDQQGPHDRDELYMVISGYGTFRRGDELVRFEAGDILFVAAHIPHCFETFSGDFRTWVIFFGPTRPRVARE
jgi:hypothetical protein